MLTQVAVPSLDSIYHIAELAAMIVGGTVVIMKIRAVAESASSRLDSYVEGQKEIQAGVNQILRDHGLMLREHDKAIAAWDGHERRKYPRG